MRDFGGGIKAANHSAIERLYPAGMFRPGTPSAVKRPISLCSSLITGG